MSDETISEALRRTLGNLRALESELLMRLSMAASLRADELEVALRSVRDIVGARRRIEYMLDRYEKHKSEESAAKSKESAAERLG